jgi:hypothetical protein
MLKVIQGLLQKGLRGEEILRTFLSRGVQLLCQREMAVRLSPGPSHLVHPFITRVSSTKINTRVADARVPEDSARREARRVCSKQLQLQRLKRQAKGDLELACPLAACAEKPSPVASALVDRGILHPPLVSSCWGLALDYG